MSFSVTQDNLGSNQALNEEPIVSLSSDSLRSFTRAPSAHLCSQLQLGFLRFGHVTRFQNGN